MPLPWIFQVPLKNVGKAISMKNCAWDRKIDGGNGNPPKKIRKL